MRKPPSGRRATKRGWSCDASPVSKPVEDYCVQGRPGWARLHEKGGKEHEMPRHHNLDRYLEEYIVVIGIGDDRKGPLFNLSPKERNSMV